MPEAVACVPVEIIFETPPRSSFSFTYNVPTVAGPIWRGHSYNKLFTVIPMLTLYCSLSVLISEEVAFLICWGSLTLMRL